ncbi:MAG: DUF3604 domain-containing protein [Pseudomonadales bacterium]|jgi:hypothetical protein|nr:DUF3604 domain-containing protein [Pseudomonadales bacterium]
MREKFWYVMDPSEASKDVQCDLVGEDEFLWGSDYPHIDSRIGAMDELYAARANVRAAAQSGAWWQREEAVRSRLRVLRGQATALTIRRHQGGRSGMRNVSVGLMVVLLAACGERASEQQPAATGAEVPEERQETVQRAVAYTEERLPCDHYTETRLPLFGDLHVHTNFSFDAAANSIGATPVDAHLYAKGEAIDFWPLDENGAPGGSFAIDRPLDFLAVTDHGEFLGERRLCREEGSPRYDSAFCQGTRESERQSMLMLGQVITTETPFRVPEVCGEDGELCREYARTPWQHMAQAANEAYDRSAACTFTSFVAYEYTGTPGTSNYHRNVVFRNANVPELPVSYVDAPYDSLLWRKLDAACTADAGCDYLTIPHNSNLANGRMAPYMRLKPTLENRREYAQKRLEREPIMEIFQHKGNSECINGLTSVLAEPDELCDMERVRVMGQEKTYATRELDGAELILGTATEVTAECGDEVGANGMLGAGCVHPTDFHRSGLLVGLSEEQASGYNPVKLGAIGSTDTHAATPGAVLEDDWRGHVSVEATPAERLQPGLLTSGIDGNPGGLAGVWAMENSRDAIFEAMQRREVFATTGPRIVPRFFAGWRYDADLCERADLVETGYAEGVPMGGNLAVAPSAGAKPVFVASALRDPADGATPLQQLQLVKGWVEADGSMRSSVTTIAGGANDASVDVATGIATGDGHDSLCAVYRDETFDSARPSYYYLRAVENRSARWHVHDCLRLAETERPAVCTDGSYPAEIQEMAWSSPVWYRPAL